MPTLNASSLTNLINATLDAEDAENLIDAACNRITAHGYEISVLTGTAGTKTKTVTQAELGWIQAVAVALYPSWKSSGSTSQSISFGPVSQSQSNSASMGGSSTAPDELAEEAAVKLTKVEESDYSSAFI